MSDSAAAPIYVAVASGDEPESDHSALRIGVAAFSVHTPGQSVGDDGEGRSLTSSPVGSDDAPSASPSPSPSPSPDPLSPSSLPSFAPITARGRHRNNFDVVRFFAAAMVIVRHSFALIKDSGAPFGLGLGDLGIWSVVTFFTISGYLITKSWISSPRAWEFTRKRVGRIWPGLALCVLLIVFVLGPVFTTWSLGAYFTSSQTWLYLAKALSLCTMDFFLPGVWDNWGSDQDQPGPASVNSSLWTIPLEVKCYVGVMLLGLLGLLRDWRSPALLALAAGIVYEFTNELSFYYVAFFWMGALFHFLEKRISRTNAGVVLAVIFLNYNVKTAYVLYPYILFSFCLDSAASVTLPFSLLSRWGEMGDFSYGLYVYGWPVQRMIQHWINPSSPWLLAVVSVFATIPLAVASWFLVEKPALAYVARSGNSNTSSNGRRTGS